MFILQPFMQIYFELRLFAYLQQFLVYQIKYENSLFKKYILKHLQYCFNYVLIYFSFQVEVSSATTCWPGSSLYIMTLSFPDKQSWVSALEQAVQDHQKKQTLNSKPRYKGTPLLTLDRSKKMDINCAHLLTEKVGDLNYCLDFIFALSLLISIRLLRKTLQIKTKMT